MHLIRDIRIIENAMGDGIKVISKDEMTIREKLAKPKWFKELFISEVK